MTVKQSGLGWSCAIRDNVAGCTKCHVNCVTNVDFSTPRNSQVSTGMDKSAEERILLLGDYQSNWSGVFNCAACKAHSIYKDIGTSQPTTSTTESLVISGQTLTNEVLLTDYAVTRAASGELTWVVPAVLQSGTDPTWS